MALVALYPWSFASRSGRSIGFECNATRVEGGESFNEIEGSRCAVHEMFAALVMYLSLINFLTIECVERSVKEKQCRIGTTGRPRRSLIDRIAKG